MISLGKEHETDRNKMKEGLHAKFRSSSKQYDHRAGK